MTTAYLNRISTAVPEHDVHDAFVVFAEQMLADPWLRPVFRRMVSRVTCCEGAEIKQMEQRVSRSVSIFVS